MYSALGATFVQKNAEKKQPAWRVWTPSLQRVLYDARQRREKMKPSVLSRTVSMLDISELKHKDCTHRTT